MSAQAPAARTGAAPPRASPGLHAGAIVALHALGWGLCLSQAASHPMLLGLGISAYLFGLRHGFDADHIAAIDDTVRLMLQRGRDPLAVGLFFSLGHSTVVFALSVLAALFAALVRDRLGSLEAVGSLLGTLVSAGFLIVVGWLNLRILVDLLRLRRRHGARHEHSHAAIDALLAGRGLLARLLARLPASRPAPLMRHAWQIFPVGLLFGLGFDTASEIALLSLAGTASGHVGWAGVLSLPTLFAAGMALVDSADCALMTRAYAWTLLQPARRLRFNLLMTSMSVALALGVAGVELAQLLIGRLGLHGAAAGALERLSLNSVGVGVVGLSAGLASGVWGVSRAMARIQRRGPAR